MIRVHFRSFRLGLAVYAYGVVWRLPFRKMHHAVGKRVYWLGSQ